MTLARKITGLVVLTLVLACSAPGDAGRPAAASDPLPSWNDGQSKQQILDFVARVTDPAGADFVPEPERIVTFDNDGTLWSESPLYFQLAFALDRLRSLAVDHPEWRTEQPFKAILEDDREALATMGHHELGQLLAATHAGVTSEEFATIAREWLDSARHPRFDRPYHECIYQPMLEVLSYLRANGFKTFIVSGGGIEFIRTFALEAYGIPVDQVVGSSAETEFRVEGSRTFLMRLPKLHFNDDKEGKPVAINRYIGRRPIAAFGNSDGDLQMLQYAAGGDGATLMVLVHHDDAAASTLTTGNPGSAVSTRLWTRPRPGAGRWSACERIGERSFRGTSRWDEALSPPAVPAHARTPETTTGAFIGTSNEQEGEWAIQVSSRKSRSSENRSSCFRPRRPPTSPRSQGTTRRRMKNQICRVQMVKGWRDREGELHEKVYDIAWSEADVRKPDAKGKLPPVGNTVNVAKATWTNTIGDAQLTTVWQDPDFSITDQAFYYVRVLEILTPRWTAYDVKRFGVTMGKEVPMTTQERAYTSPIWYIP